MDPAELRTLDIHLSPARLAPYWGPISAVEIAFRNAVHRALATHVGRPDWWNDPSMYPPDVVKARDEEKRLQRQRGRKRNTSPPTSDDVVAALSFGFWSSIVDAPRNALEQNRYWHTSLYEAFPNWHYKPGTQGRKDFVRRVELLRKFRNRVAHHEPLHRRDLARDHEALIAMAGFLDGDLSRFIADHSRVPDVLARHTPALDHGQCQF
ncbi:Abi family protein [Saccharomonospora iraqiensis]|uniref:Abi family protein n=1 Tax=Saccharomonospora iraqiensis TaxID=52698 RepID=UPI0006978466|nr:Abi family protein [Saccharomonospora iraqiensis]